MVCLHCYSYIITKGESYMSEVTGKVFPQCCVEDRQDFKLV